MNKASELGINPYAPGQIGGTPRDGRPSEPYDPRAKGLDGDMLDAVCKGRWQEGHEVGYEDGHQAARNRYVGIYDEGFDKGRTVGSAEAEALMARRLFPLLEEAGGTLVTIVDDTGSDKIKEAAQGMADKIRQTLEEVIGTYAEENAARQAQGEQPGMEKGA